MTKQKQHKKEINNRFTQVELSEKPGSRPTNLLIGEQTREGHIRFHHNRIKKQKKEIRFIIFVSLPPLPGSEGKSDTPKNLLHEYLENKVSPLLIFHESEVRIDISRGCSVCLRIPCSLSDPSVLPPKVHCQEGRMVCEEWGGQVEEKSKAEGLIEERVFGK